MLGELYQPKGLALETARAVLEVDDPWAVNVAWGCSNECTYCYNRRLTRGLRMSYPKEPPADLVRKQLEKGIEPEAVFISFGTEPLLRENIENTIAVANLLRDYDIRAAVLSKMGTLDIDDFEVRHGGREKRTMNREEAKAKCLPGWNLRCNLCGEYPAEWIRRERPGWGSLALCSKHKAELIAERERHEKEMKRLRTINFEQDTRRDM